MSPLFCCQIKKPQATKTVAAGGKKLSDSYGTKDLNSRSRFS